MDRLYAIKKPLEYSDVLKKNQLLRSLRILSLNMMFLHLVFFQCLGAQFSVHFQIR